MDDFEGSTNVEGIDTDEVSEESTNENINNQENETKDSPEEETPAEGSEEGGAQITDKGTKLDPNPQSAVHQELANYKREVEQYREFMNNPDALKTYVRDMEEQAAQATGQTVKQVQDQAEEEFVTDPNKIETVDDLRSYAKYLGKTVEDTKKNLDSEMAKTKSDNRDKAVADTLVSEINGLQAKYPELRQTNSDGTPNPDFDPILEKEIADLYEEFDTDPRTGKYMGRASITKIADRFMKVRNGGESAGSKRAQTVVLDKRSGAVKTTSGGTSSPDESKMSGAQLIASRMQKAMRNR